MKLLRYGQKGRERPGLLDAEGRIRDLSGIIDDLDPTTVTPTSLGKLRRLKPASLPLVRGRPRIGVPVARIGKIIAVGLNYADHAKEAGLPIPKEPVLFTKHINAISGPYDPVQIPRGAKKTDWEVEIAFVIGKRARYVEESKALGHIAGYTILNDVSEREFQIERGGQWMKGKCHDTFAPIGPWLVTTDEITEPQKLHMWLEVNGKRYQDGSTTTMIFNCNFQLAYISQFLTLEPGDVVTTGTPPGVGLGQKPPVYLKVGDVMELGIEGLGTQRQELVPA
ncbi:MAG: fumarylacetoacetate hydrolase family protein [Alphaproteobacteria bacterium]|nr:fumarylacetoacetate hydrolase family protein [Alphaproteobacteria bacterium]